VAKISANSPLQKARENLMISKMEMARKADISPITVARIENGKPFRISTKRKIVEALGFNPSLSKKI
jgi:predicted transcriptional regulator